MTHYPHPEKLARLSTHREELFAAVSACCSNQFPPPEFADEIAATAGEVMVELADHRDDSLAGSVIEGARRLREIARSVSPETARITRAGRALVCDLEVIIREDKRAA
jgi:hypothetical protein